MKRIVLFGVMCLLGIGLTVQAGVVNVNFQAGSGPVEDNGGAAFGEGVTMYWNDYVDSLTTIENCLDSDGAATSVDITDNHDGRYWGALGSELTYGYDIMDNYHHNSNHGYKDMIIAGLTPDSSYDLYLYGHGDQESQNTIFTIDGVSKSSTIDVAGLTELTENAHYVIFTGVLADSSGQIIVNWGAETYAAINGLQIIGEMPVPEPATLALLGLGALISLKRRK